MGDRRTGHRAAVFDSLHPAYDRFASRRRVENFPDRAHPSALLSTVPVLILRYLDRRERESPWVFAIAILWGALIATGLALPLNASIIAAVARWLDQYPEIRQFLGPHGAMLLGAPLAAPIVEEATKALGVILFFTFLRAEFDNMRDGFVYGALVGVGFNLFEAPLYVAQGFAEYGVAPWGFQFGARFALFGLGGHAMFTGIFGAFVRVARQTRRLWLASSHPSSGSRWRSSHTLSTTASP